MMKRDSYRWLIWGVMSLTFFVVFLQRYVIAVIADDLSGAMGLTGTHLSNLGSMYFYAYFLMQVPMGLLIDSLGPRKVTSLGMFLAAMGSFIFATSSSIQISYLARFLIGAGMAPILISILKFQSLWFRAQEFATITGITSVVGNLGGIAAATPFAFLVMAISWRSSFWLLGFISLSLSLLLYLIVRDTPKDMGYEEFVAREDQIDLDLWLVFKRVILNPYTWPNFVIFFGGLGVIMSFSGLWGVPFLMHVFQLSRDTAANQVLFYTLGVVFGSPLWGYLSDRFKSRRLVMLSGLSVALLLWIFFYFLLEKVIPSYWALCLIFFFMGFFGISVLLCFTAVKEVNLPQYAGISTSFVNIAPFMGTAVLNLLVGWRLDTLFLGTRVNGVRIYSIEGYRQGFLVYIIALTIALLMILFVKEKKA